MSAGREVVLSTAVMSHPRRAGQAEELRQSLPELSPEVVYDPEPTGAPSAWRTARRAWATVGRNATHHLVLQDDVTPAAGFVDSVLDAIAVRPKAPLCLFVEWGSRTANAVRLAAMRGHSWAPVVDDYIPCAALILPAEMAAGFDEYAAARSTEADPDDVVLLDYLTALGAQSYAPVENLVQHDVSESLVGNNIMGLRRSVLFRGDSAPAPVTDSTLTGLTAVPYYDWWSQQATLFVPDRTKTDGWGQLRWQPALDHLGVAPAEVEAGFVELYPRLKDVELLDDRVSRILSCEIYKTAFLLGLVAAEMGPVPQVAAGSPAAQALATLAPGGLRRVVPERWLSRTAALLEPVVLAGVEAGAHRGAARDFAA